MTRTTPMFRMALFGLMLLAVVLAGALHAEAAEPAPKPYSAFVVTQCGKIVSAYITWRDGHVTLIDSAHHEGYDDTDALKRLVLSADQNKVLDMDCEAVGHASI